MKKFITILGLLCVHFQFAAAKLDITTIKWENIKTKVRWLNFYEKNTLITLVVDDVPALKRVGVPGYFAPTKFPEGNFPCQIIDSVSGEKMIGLQISTTGENQYCLVTYGSEKNEMQSIFLTEDIKPLKEKKSTLTIYNMLPDGDLQWQLPDMPSETISIGKARQITFDTAAGFSMNVPAKTASGSKSMKLQIAAEAEDGNWIAFCHYGGPSGKELEMSYIKQGTTAFILGGANAHEQ